MKLGKKQEKFSLMLGKLLMFIYAHGYQVRMGDVWAHDRHSENSNHYIKLAADINLFKDDEYLTNSNDHKQFGEYWESLGGCWGGRFGDCESNRDGNHYSLEYNGDK